MPKYAGRKAVLKRGDGATPTEAFTAVPQVAVIPAFGSSRDLFDQSSYNDDWKDWGVGQQDGSELAIRLQYDPAHAQHTALKADYDSAVAKRNFRIEFPDAAVKFDFPAVVSAFEIEPDMGGNWNATVTLKIVNPGVVQSVLT